MLRGTDVRVSWRNDKTNSGKDDALRDKDPEKYQYAGYSAVWSPGLPTELWCQVRRLCRSPEARRSVDYLYFH